MNGSSMAGFWAFFVLGVLFIAAGVLFWMGAR